MIRKMCNKNQALEKNYFPCIAVKLLVQSKFFYCPTLSKHYRKLCLYLSQDMFTENGYDHSNDNMDVKTHTI